MITEQRRMLKGVLSEKEEERKSLEVGIANDLLIINAKANPFIDDFTELDVNAIFLASKNLTERVKKLKEVNNKISAITKELL